MPKKECIVLYDLYDIIKSECKKKNVSVSRMALDLGMSKSTMSALKNGTTQSLSAPKLKMVADYLGVSVSYLLGEDKKTPATEGDGQGIDFSSLSDEQKDLIRDVLKLNDQQASALRAMTEAFLAGE